MRHRPEDIPELTAFFIEKYSRQTGRAVRGVSPDADAILRNYEWPGNVRQLQNVLEQAVVLGSGEMIGKEDLPEEVLQTVPQSYRARMHRAKREIFRDAFARANGDYKQAARYLNLNPRSVHRYLRDLGLSDLLT